MIPYYNKNYCIQGVLGFWGFGVLGHTQLTPRASQPHMEVEREDCAQRALVSPELSCLYAKQGVLEPLNLSFEVV